MTRYLPYLLVGILFGFTLIKSEAASWYRIQEMFHFQSFHMFGIMLSAIVTAFLTTQLIQRLGGQKALDGQSIELPQKPSGRISYIAGGIIFGLGWGLIGLCPGPVFALVGTGSLGALIVLAGPLHGTWLYGALKQHFPH
jgi:hypothetical protein